MTKQRQELLFTVALMAFFGVLFGIASGYPKQPRELPQLVSGIALALLGIRFYRLTVNPSVASVKRTHWTSVMLVFLTLIGFFVAVEIIGTFPSAAIMLYILGVVLRAKSKTKLALVSVGIVLIYWLVFSVGAGVNLPHGRLFDLITG